VFSLVGAYSTAPLGVIDPTKTEQFLLHDDGIDGDERAGDNTYCATFVPGIEEPDVLRLTDGNTDGFGINVYVKDEHDSFVPHTEIANVYTPNLSLSILIVNPSAFAQVDVVPTDEEIDTVAATTRVVNFIDEDFTDCSFGNTSRITNKLYSLFPSTNDPFDQIIFFLATKRGKERGPNASTVKNDIGHNGGAFSDGNPEWYGSDGRLRGILCMAYSCLY
jgi:hypothetical protein